MFLRSGLFDNKLVEPGVLTAIIKGIQSNVDKHPNTAYRHNIAIIIA
jgi:hypothetical protein